MGKVIVDNERCKGCGICVEFCPKDALEIGEKLNNSGFYYVRQKEDVECNGCSLCAIMCPDVALEVYK